MSVGREITRGTAWMMSARWAIRALGVISTMILARLIEPTDYGLVAIAMLVAGAIGVFGEVGLLLFLIREQKLEKSHFDTVWTLRAIIGIGLGLVIFLMAPLSAVWFKNSEVAVVVQCLAIPTILQGFQNPGIALFRKEMNFRKDFQFMFGQKVVAFLVTVVAAFVLRNYWALVAGIVAGAATGLIQSYLIHPMRPRFDLSRTKDVWAFSTWTLVSSLLAYTVAQVPTFIVGRMSTPKSVGLYSVADDLATAPVYELSAPMGRVLIPAYSKISGDAVQLSSIFAKVFSTMAVFACSVCVGISLVAHDAVSVLLGQRWIEIVPLVEVLAIAGAFGALSQPTQALLIAIGQPRWTALLNFAQLAIGVPLLVVAFSRFELKGLALAQCATLGLTWLISLALTALHAHIGLGTILGSLWRPLVAGLLMWPAVRLAQAASPDIALARLSLAVLAGALVFGLTLFGTWRAAGSPPAIEFDILALARKVFSRLRPNPPRSGVQN